MGCVQAKYSANSPPRTALENLKLEVGYVKGENGRQVVGQKQVQAEPVKVFKHGADQNGSFKTNLSAVGGGGDKRGLSRDGGQEKNNGSLSQRIVLNKIAADEYVDGWPKWLVENVPKEALDGLAKKTADSYDMLCKVGHGTYSNVYKARDRKSGEIVALKKVRFDTSEPESVKFMAREIMMLLKLDHPNVIKLEGIVTSRMQYSLYLVFEYMQSDLTKLIFRPTVKLTLPQVKFYMIQLLSGLRHCHERGILHRDIKPSNLLIDPNGELKIADFGLANCFNPRPKKPMTSRVVTLWYRAPELLLGSTDYGIGIDLWSAGCVLAEMLQGHAFMPGRNEVEQLHRICKLCGTPSEEYWKKMKLPTSFKQLNHYKPGYHKAFAAFPPDAISLLSTLLALDPSLRGSAASALQSDFFVSSPLPCDSSGLRKICKVEETTTTTETIDKRKSQATKKRSQMRTVSHLMRDLAAGHNRECEQVKDLEKSHEINLQGGPESNSSTSSSASSVNPNGNRRTLPLSPTSYLFALQSKSFRTDVGPGNVKNVVNFPTNSPRTDFAARNGGSNKPRLSRRSLSTLDFHKLDPLQLQKLYGSDNE
uniref:Protein kinase domain-containing protein n=1 Tax=Kalanchoe fedtschenkoi TaxID=63787 RepID=A0A7N0T8W5_KALFE